MGPLDGLWHLLNFFAPAMGVALVAASLAKLVWRKDLSGVPWLRLVLSSAAAGALALIAALIFLGRDGTMAGYGLLAASSAVALWWAGFMRR